MADEVYTVLLLVEAEDHASKQLQSMRGELDKTGSSLSGMGGKMDEAAGKEEKLASKSESMGSRVGGVFEKLGQQAQNWGLPFGNILSETGEKMGDVEGKSTSLASKLGTLGKVTTVGVAAGFVAASVEALHLTANYEKSEAALSATADISSSQADKIGKAFVSVGSASTQSAAEMIAAYTPVAGQLGAVQGHALDASQALSVVKASTDLAEASGGKLAGSLADEAKIMQAFGQNTTAAAADADVLFNSSRLTGNSVDSMTSSVTKLKAQLGATAPSLTDTSALIVDLSEHGETGRQAMTAVNTAMTSLLKTTDNTKAVASATKALATAQQGAQTAAEGVATAQRNLGYAQEEVAASGKDTVANQISIAKANDAVTAAQEKAALAAGKVTTAEADLYIAGHQATSGAQELGINLYNAQGQFVGMGNVIAQLEPKLRGMTQAQQLSTLSTLFGTQANRKLLDTILAGPQTFDKITDSITAHGSAEAAAEKATNTLSGQTEKLKAGVEDLGISYGEWLTPKLKEVERVGTDVVLWLEKNKVVAEGLAVVIGGVLTVAVATFAYQTAAKFVSSVGDMITGVGKLKDKITGIGGESGLGQEGETASSALDNAAQALQEAASALNEAAQTLVGAGNEVGTEIEAGATEAASTLDTAGGEVATEIEGGATEAAATMQEGGAGAGAEEGEEGEEEDGGGGGLGAAAGGAAIGGMVGVQVGKAITGSWKTSGLAMLGPIKQVYQAGMSATTADAAWDDMMKLNQAGGQLVAAKNKMGHNLLDAKAIGQLSAGISQVQAWADDVQQHWATLAAGGGGSTGSASGGVGGSRSAATQAQSMRSMAMGGVVTSDTIAMLHAPEVVLPLNDPNRMNELLASVASYLPSPSGGGGGSSGGSPAASAGRGGTTIQNLNVYLLTQPLDAQGVAQAVSWEVRKV